MAELSAEQRRVIVAAIEVAIAAPDQQQRYAFAAKVSWTRIHELRDALEAAGIDWRDVKRTQETRDDERIRERTGR